MADTTTDYRPPQRTPPTEDRTTRAFVVAFQPLEGFRPYAVPTPIAGRDELKAAAGRVLGTELKDQSVSRAHIRLSSSHGGNLELVSLKPELTRVNGWPITPGESVTLFGGEVIRLGATLLVYRPALPRGPNDLSPDSDLEPIAPTARDDRATALVSPYGLRALRRALDDLSRVRPRSVLVHGETGTGKERIVHAVAAALGRSSVVPVNSAALSPELVRAELFGTDRGAFTGAEKKAGAVRDADKARAVLYLDEIGDLPLVAQGVLLRYLQNDEVAPVGAAGSIERVSVPVVMATHRDLPALAEEGKFRHDLLARMERTLEVPPLRERPEDVFAVLRYLWEGRTGISGRPELVGPTDEVEALLLSRHPENVRGLSKVVLEVAMREGNCLHLSPGLVKRMIKTEPRAALCRAAVDAAYAKAEHKKGSKVSDEAAFEWLKKRAVEPFFSIGTLKRFRD